MSWCHSSKNMV